MSGFIVSRRLMSFALIPILGLLVFCWARSTSPVIAQGAAVCATPPTGLVSWWPGDGNANDIQGSNNGTLVNGATFADGKVGQAFSLDGVDDLVSIPDAPSLDLLTAGTISMWAYFNDASNLRVLIAKGTGNGNAASYTWGTYADVLRFDLYRGDASLNYATVTMPTSALVGGWNFLTATWDGSTLRHYLNGVLQSSVPYSFVRLDTPYAVNIGLDTAGNSPIHGRLDEIELYNRTLSVSEIQAIFNAGSAGKCTAPATICNNVWAETTTVGAPAGRTIHKAVWTGTEMIVWGGEDSSSSTINTGGRYNPATNSWTPTSTIGAPTGRSYFTAVWTGTEMIVWGGRDNTSSNFNTGGRYNPVTDTWTPTSTLGAPSARQEHTAVWTGTEMIVWGGQNGGGGDQQNTGGRYNPATDTWTPTSTTNAPSARAAHIAVWTDTEMIVWAGQGPYPDFPNTGGRYNPTTDSWIPTSTTNAPSARFLHNAVWTGTEMIVWGGRDSSLIPLNTGSRYNPMTDSWIATNTTSAPAARALHTAVWTGAEMIIWGGFGSSISLNTGGRYDPATDNWTATATTNAPSERGNHTAIWAVSEMIIWGGGNHSNTGGRYCHVRADNAPVARCQNVTVSGPACEANASIDDGSFDPDGDPLTVTQSPAGPYRVGSTDVMLTVTDGNGPPSTCNATVTVVDNTVPVIPSLPSITRTSDPGLCSAVVFLVRPRVGDNCGIASVSNNAPAGNVFPVGTTTVTWTATDVNGNSSTATQTVTVTNPAPVVTMAGPPTGSVYPVNTPVSFTGSFADNPGDTHTATWMFDNLTSAGTVNETTGEITGSFSFTTAGIYKVSLTVMDGCGGTGSASTINELDLLVVIYDPGAGFVTGGGWINSPAGAYVPNPSLAGKANFGFVSRYHYGAMVPTGNTEFQFKTGSLNFHSTSYEWLVVAGKKAQYKGSGKINGTGEYDFMLTAIDGQQPGGDGMDKFRIRIWDRTNGGLIYDNQLNAADSDDPTTLLGGGSIVIHK